MPSNETFYRQCELRRGEERQVTWIPEKFARLGKIVKLRERKLYGCILHESEWDEGWVCHSVGRVRCPESMLNDREYLYHRKRSDI